VSADPAARIALALRRRAAQLDTQAHAAEAAPKLNERGFYPNPETMRWLAGEFAQLAVEIEATEPSAYGGGGGDGAP
jgi:hypothetical protein